jgi:hypothetical protein
MALRRLLVAALIIVALEAVCVCADPSDNPQRVRQELKSVLSDPQYNRDYQPHSDWSEAIARAVASLLELLVVKDTSLGEVLSFLMAILIIAAFIGLVALLLSKFVNASERLSDSAGVSIPTDLPQSRPLLREAEMLAARGDYRGALRCAYLACISYLDEIQAIRFERSRTNWEYLRELRATGREQIHDLLRPLTALFDQKVYGGEECREPDYEMALQVYYAITTEAAA